MCKLIDFSPRQSRKAKILIISYFRKFIPPLIDVSTENYLHYRDVQVENNKMNMVSKGSEHADFFENRPKIKYGE